MAIIAVAATTEPELRSIPPEMMTCVTPTAMMPTIETCRMMIESRAWLKRVSTFARVLKRKESPMRSQPSASKAATISTSAARTLSSGGRWRLGASKVSPPVPCVDSATAGIPCRRLAGSRAGARAGPAVGPQFFARKSPMFAGVTSWNGM